MLVSHKRLLIKCECQSRKWADPYPYSYPAQVYQVVPVDVQCLGTCQCSSVCECKSVCECVWVNISCELLHMLMFGAPSSTSTSTWILISFVFVLVSRLPGDPLLDLDSGLCLYPSNQRCNVLSTHRRVLCFGHVPEQDSRQEKEMALA